MGLLELLKALFGKGYLNKIIGTRTNVAKPIRMDKDSPFKKYSDSAFDDPKVLSYIEKKIDEYGPYALNNKNPQELANFEDNAKRLLAAKNKQTGSTPGMAQQIAESMFGPLGKKPKPEAEIVDIRTQQKVKPQGIETLKSEIGLPEGVEPGSVADKAIKESAEYKMNQQGVKSLLDENYVPPKTTSIDEDEIADINLKEDIAKLTDREARAYSANIESYRRPIIREMLLKDTKIKLPDDVRKSLENKDDLQRGANPEMDPLRLLNEYYDVDFNKLDELEEIRFTARNETEAADEFLKKGGLEPKKPMVRESLDDEAVELEETKDLGDKLKDYDGDPDGLAEGGRIGFKKGGIKALLAMFGKKGVKTADQIEQPDFAKLKKEFDAFNKRNRKLTDEEYEDLVAEYGEGVPQLETVADAEKFVQGQKDYQAAMFRDYKAGKLDPVAGEETLARMKFLEQRAEEAEMSGDPRLFTSDDADELTMLQAKMNPENVKLSYADKDKRMIPEGLTEEDVDFAILKGEFERKYSKLIPEDLMKKIMADDDPQRVKEIIGHVEQAAIMTDKGMSADQVIDAFKAGEKRKDNADGGLNYLMGL